MAETAYPYATYLDIKFDPLTLIDVSSLAKTVTDQWYNQTLCKVNDSVIRLGAAPAGQFAFSDAKRLFRQHRPKYDIHTHMPFQCAGLNGYIPPKLNGDQLHEYC